MTDLETELGQRQFRSFEIRAVDTEKREVRGIGVPWGQTADLGWFTESMERGAVQDSDDAQLWWRHRDPIGRVIEQRDADEGWDIAVRISKTQLGDDALTLVRDGVVTNFSIGFEPVEYTIREDGPTSHVTHTRIRVREVSLVPLPAYEGAKVTDVREGVTFTNQERKTMTGTVTDPAAPSSIDLEARQGIEDLERRMATFTPGQYAAPQVDTRSAGQILKAIAAGDQATIEQYNALAERAYDGGTTADLGTTLKPGWVGDLTRIIDEAAPLREFFAKGTLPESGMSIEYGELASDTTAYDEQAAEGDDLDYGKVTVTTKTAPVKTFGGYSSLSRQTIERSSVNVLQTTLEAQAVRAGKRMNAAVRAAFVALHTSQTTAGNVIDLPAVGSLTAIAFLEGIVDAAVKFEQNGLGLDGLLANAKLFKLLLGLEDSAGRPLLLVTPNAGGGVNNVGTINPKALTGDLAGLRVVLDAGLSNTAASGAFANGRSIRSYITPFVRLQDENIVNLTKSFSLYNYAAFAAEIPHGVAPVKFAV